MSCLTVAHHAPISARRAAPSLVEMWVTWAEIVLGAGERGASPVPAARHAPDLYVNKANRGLWLPPLRYVSTSVTLSV
jgi:hypothetical protein